MLIKADKSIDEILEDLKEILIFVLNLCKPVIQLMYEFNDLICYVFLGIHLEEFIKIITVIEEGKKHLDICISFWAIVLAIAILIIIFIIRKIKNSRKRRLQGHRYIK